MLHLKGNFLMINIAEGYNYHLSMTAIHVKSHLVINWRPRGDYHLLNYASIDSIKLFAWQ